MKDYRRIQAAATAMGDYEGAAAIGELLFLTDKLKRDFGYQQESEIRRKELMYERLERRRKNPHDFEHPFNPSGGCAYAGCMPERIVKRGVI